MLVEGHAFRLWCCAAFAAASFLAIAIGAAATRFVVAAPLCGRSHLRGVGGQASALLCWRRWYGRAPLRLRKERHAEVQRVYECQDEVQEFKFLSQMCAVLNYDIATLAHKMNIWLDVSGNSSTEVGNAMSAYNCVAEALE